MVIFLDTILRRWYYGLRKDFLRNFLQIKVQAFHTDLGAGLYQKLTGTEMLLCQILLLWIIISVLFELMSFTRKNHKKSVSDSGTKTFKNACFMSLIKTILFNRQGNKIWMIGGSVFDPVSEHLRRDHPFSQMHQKQYAHEKLICQF